ncbi:hypothetical protein LTS18_005296 [Coniosporium uncinatum]|uniref:Uncharacterized protein n=1 Tax=Coniosporium uncinatum TaxID=93489 RepID=A0ACC3DRX1_9PEZI|nr:hypothetical protein LTS18_005296 [Coniosporium uncinatum]
MSLLVPLLALSLSVSAFASYHGNLNYRSPSNRGNHARMGIKITHLEHRSLTKRQEPNFDASRLNFTHGVASGDPNVTVEGTVDLYNHDNQISNNLDHADYDSETGEGSVGVEFAGTGVASGGTNESIAWAEDNIRPTVAENVELQWHERYYRGYFELHINAKELKAQYFGTATVTNQNPWDLPLANFTVTAGANKLNRPVAGGRVEAGVLKIEETRHTNVTLNTETGDWGVIGFERQIITSPVV